MSKKHRNIPEKKHGGKVDTAKETEKNAAEEAAEKAVEKDIGTQSDIKNDNKRKTLDPRKKHGIMSIAFTAIFITAVVVLNIIVGLLTDRFGLRADLTASGMYTLDKQTEYYLDYFLNTDISITVTSSEKHFVDEGEYFKQINEILQKLSAYSERITLDYLELEQNPDFAARFSGETLVNDYVVVENKKSGRYRIITPIDYFGLDDETAMYYYYYYGYIGNSLIEQEAVSAMIYVSDDDPAKIVFTEGFGEHGSEALSRLLSKNGYDVETVNLLTGELPEDADAVVIYAPSSDLNAEQLAKLDKFLDNNGKLGKNVFYFASSDQPKTPNIDGFLSDWGLEIGYSVIGHTNPDYMLNAQTYYMHLQQVELTDFTEESYKKGFILGSDLRPVYTLPGTSNAFDVLMRSYEKAFLYPLDNEGEFDLAGAETGIFNDVVMSTKRSSDSVSRVCAAGSETLAGNTLMSYANAGNQTFFLGVFDSVLGKNKGISITPKSFETIYFDMSAGTANVFAVILCIVIPVGIVVFGVVIYFRRRHR
ncbi:MAG: GldG family protein [Oscillospiraceae bacterium]|nr:GldG family protein [Oscillospiraceae bacterium]